jgi:FkbM family methyltransferase
MSETTAWDRLLERSINAYYEGELAEGRLACDQLLCLPDLPESVRWATRTNQIFYASRLGTLVSGYREAVIDVAAPSGAASSPTVAADGDEWLVLLSTSGKDASVPCDVSAPVGMALCHYHQRLDPLGAPAAVVDQTAANDHPDGPVHRFEECRLVRLGDRWLATVLLRDRRSPATCQLALLDFDPIAPALLHLRPLTGRDRVQERQWAPVVVGAEIFLLSSFGPTAILRCDVATGALALTEIHDAPFLAGDLAATSPLVEFAGGFLGLAYDTIVKDSGETIRLHRFVRFDPSFRVSDLSHPFRLEENGHALAGGLARNGERLALAYAVDGQLARLATLDLAEAAALLRPVELLVPGGPHPFPLPPDLLAALATWAPPPRHDPGQRDPGQLPVLRPETMIDMLNAERTDASPAPASADLPVSELALGSPWLVSVTVTGESAGEIGDALRSVVDWVDRCVVVDTGRDDGAIEAARSVAGAKLVVRPFAWTEDLASALNDGLAAAAASGAAWAVLVAPDERIVRRSLDVRATLADTDADVLFAENEAGELARERFVRLPARGSFVGPTHSMFVGGQQDQLDRLRFVDAPKSDDVKRREYERDVALLLRFTASHPDEPRWFYSLGSALQWLGRRGEAIAAYRTCADLKGWNEEGAWACYRAAECWLALGNPDAAIESCTTGLAIHAGMAELPWLAGYAAWQARRPAQTVYWARLSATLGLYRGHGAAISRTGPRHPPAYWEGPYDLLRFALRAIGSEAEADAAERDYRQAAAARVLAREGGMSEAAAVDGAMPRLPPEVATEFEPASIRDTGRTMLRPAWRELARTQAALAFAAPAELPVAVAERIGKLHGHPTDRVIIEEIRRSGRWEAAETEFLASALRPGMNVLDLGANVGYHTRLCGELVGATGQVLAVEADPITFGVLLVNLREASHPNVEALNVAASDRPHQVRIDRSHGWWNPGGNWIWPASESGNDVVEAVALDDVLDPEVPLSFIKCDVEGSDHLALDGLQHTIARWAPRILVEWNPGLIERLGGDPTAVLHHYAARGWHPIVFPGELDVLARVGNTGDFLDSTLRIRPGRERIAAQRVSATPMTAINLLLTPVAAVVNPIA